MRRVLSCRYCWRWSLCSLGGWRMRSSWRQCGHLAGFASWRTGPSCCPIGRRPTRRRWWLMPMRHGERGRWLSAWDPTCGSLPQVYYWNKSDVHHLLKMARSSMYIFFLQETQPAAQWAACFLYRSNIHHESAMTMTRRHTAQWAAWWTCDRSMNSISSLRIKVRKKHDLISFGVN